MIQELTGGRYSSQINGVPKSATTNAMSPTLPELCGELRWKVTQFLKEKTDNEILRRTQEQVRVSMRVIEQALRKYGPEELSLSYNGGKDCVVLLVLILACWPTYASSTSASTPQSTHLSQQNLQPLQGVYIVSPNPFAEVEDFVRTSTKTYKLNLSRITLPMRPALEAYLSEKPTIKAIFVGTRQTDPNGKFLTHFDPTDKDWPQFMRIHPVVDWNYTEIWAFLRHLEIPFCDLYNRGFTSLGGVTDTLPNPALAVKGDPTKFRPAYDLMEDDEERLGRDFSTL